VTPDPLLDRTQAPYQYAADSPLNRTDPAGLYASLGWPPLPTRLVIDDLARRFWTWANTSQNLPNPNLVTAPINIAYGVQKVAWGVEDLFLGAGFDATIIGGLIGVPLQGLGLYNLITGSFRISRGIKQQQSGSQSQTVRKTPLEWCWDVFLNLAPGGGGVEDVIGGLP
jgi:hypothetical protein